MISPPGLSTASNSLTSSASFSRCTTVMEFFGTSMSSAMMVSAREPVSWPLMPTDFTEGD